VVKGEVKIWPPLTEATTAATRNPAMNSFIFAKLIGIFENKLRLRSHQLDVC